MREIEFRGKRIDNGKWVYGYLFKIWEHCFILWGTTNDMPNMIEVIPETVGQFTGLIDKNGKKIYEGDIVRCWGGEQCQGYHEFGEEITVNDMTYDAYYVGQWDGCLVIGNINDNPELLGGAE